MSFLNDWLKNGGKRPDKLGRFTVESDKWDVKRFEQMLEEMREFDKERYALCEVVQETGNGMWADAFFLFNKVDPKLRPSTEIQPRYLINRQVMDEAKDLPELVRVHQWTEGDPVAAAAGCITIRPDLERLYDKTKTANDKAEDLQQQIQQLAQANEDLEELDRNLDDLIQDWKEQGGSEDDVPEPPQTPQEDEEGEGESEGEGDQAGGDQEGEEGGEGEGEGEGGEGEGDEEGQVGGTPSAGQGSGGKPTKGKGKKGKGQSQQPSDEQREEFQEKAADLQAQRQLIEEHRRRLEAMATKTGEELTEEQAQSANAVRQIMKEALAKAADEMDAAAAVAQMWGLDPGELIRLPAKKRLELAKRLNDERFKRMADLFGPMERLMHAERRRRVNDIPEEIYDIGMGNDLERLLPTEYAKLMHPQRKLEFYKDFTEKRLLQYEMRGHDIVARGGIVVCIDNSGSMAGDRELWAKAIGLCLLHLSREQKRNFYGIHFGWASEIEIFDFENEGYDLDRIIDFAEFFFNGGTDFQTPLSLGLDKLKAEFAAKGAVDADIVFITDGLCGVDPQWLEEFRSEIDRIEATVWGILIDDPKWSGRADKTMEPLNTICDGLIATVQDILSGRDVVEMFKAV